MRMKFKNANIFKKYIVFLMGYTELSLRIIEDGCKVIKHEGSVTLTISKNQYKPLDVPEPNHISF